jgi:hypothetical protein
MMRESPLVVVLATAICTLVGILGGIALGKLGQTPSVATVTPAAPIAGPQTSTPLPPGTQISILVLGVDSLVSPKPVLEGCWVITFQTDAPQYYFLGFSPATLVNVPGATDARTLSEVYTTDRRIGRGTAFTRDALKSISPGLPTPGYEAVFDRQMLAWLVDQLNGILLRGEWVTGEMLLARYDAIPPDNPMDRMIFQGEALDAILKAAQQRDWSGGAWQAYLNRGQQWEPNAEAFGTLAETMLDGAPQAEFYINYAPLAPEQPTSTRPR